MKHATRIISCLALAATSPAFAQVEPAPGTLGQSSTALIALLIFLAIGAVAGWLAGNLMRGGGFGLLGNIVVGIIGSLLGGYLLGLLGINLGGLVGSIVTATAGAALLLFIVGLIRK